LATEIKVPSLGESVTSATVARWIKQPGEAVVADEPLVELETDKVTVEVNAPVAGVLTAISVAEGTEVEVGAVLGVVDPAGTQTIAGPAANPTAGVRPPPRSPGPVSRPAAPPPPTVPAAASAVPPLVTASATAVAAFAPAPLPAAAKIGRASCRERV